MDEDLANIIRTALDEAKTAGRDDSGQTEYSVRIEAMPNFLLYADDKPFTIFDTLDEAKSRAKEFIGQGKAVRIESLDAPAPSEVCTKRRSPFGGHFRRSRYRPH